MSNDDILKAKSFSRRVFILTGIQLSLLTILAGRLFYLQLIKADQYKTLSENNSIKLSLIAPVRGKILDRQLINLATNQINYRLISNLQESDDRFQLIERLRVLLSLNDEIVLEIVSKIKTASKKERVILLDNLLWDDVARIEVNAQDLRGLSIETIHNRYYPFGKIAAHLVGYVTSASEVEFAKNPLLAHINLLIGKGGIEKFYEESLRGSVGGKRMEVNAYGKTIRELSREEPKSGKDLTLTIDMRLQQLAAERLGDNPGAVALLDIATGDVLVSLSAPSFDPNKFNQGISHSDWQELIQDSSSPLINKVIAAQYPPGSIFKMIVALSALGEGIIAENRIHCPGYVAIGTRRFHCWKKDGHGSVNMSEAISGSCNAYFYTIAKKIGIDNIVSMAQKFGLGNKSGIELPGEVAGLLPSRSWKFRKYNKEWLIGDTINSAVGQGYVLTTIMQLAVMTARIASGKEIIPRIVQAAPLIFTDLDIPLQHLNIIRQGMSGVLQSPIGTAYGKNIPDQDFAMAGKTGTAQVVSKKSANQDFSKAGTKWAHKNHAGFIAFAPYHCPRFACAAILEHGGGGGNAIPIVRDLLFAAQKL